MIIWAHKSRFLLLMFGPKFYVKLNFKTWLMSDIMSRKGYPCIHFKTCCKCIFSISTKLDSHKKCPEKVVILLYTLQYSPISDPILYISSGRTATEWLRYILHVKPVYSTRSSIHIWMCVFVLLSKKIYILNDILGFGACYTIAIENKTSLILSQKYTKRVN